MGIQFTQLTQNCTFLLNARIFSPAVNFFAEPLASIRGTPGFRRTHFEKHCSRFPTVQPTELSFPTHCTFQLEISFSFKLTQVREFIIIQARVLIECMDHNRWDYDNICSTPHIFPLFFYPIILLRYNIIVT